MWDEEGGDGEDRVVSSEPDLVGPIPGQGVQVVHEHRLLHVLPHQLVKLMECLHVSRTDKASARHFKAVEGGLVGGDVSQKVRAMAMLTEKICQRNSNLSPYISKLYF